jgi:phage terminase Nu1 subunit (DNA packaging protein)
MTKTQTKLRLFRGPEETLGEWVTSLQVGIREERIRSLLGAWKVPTHAELARIFGVQASTIRQSWVPAGMPNGQDTDGMYSVADVFVWRVAHESQIRTKRTPAKDDTAANLEKRMQQAEVEKAEADAEKARLTVDEMEKRLIDPTLIVSAFTSLLSELREELVTVGDEMQPTFPIGREKELAEEVNRRNSRILQAASEKASRTAQQYAPAQ